MSAVVSAVALGAPHTELLAGWELEVVDLLRAGDAELEAALRETEALLVNSHFPVDARVLGFAPRLRAISTVSVGFDHIDVRTAAQRSITVTTTPVLSDAVADLTLALITMTLRRLRETIDDLSRGVWRNEILGHDVRGQRLLLIGFGRIAREVAARALAAKMTVCTYDVRTEIAPMAGVDRVATLAEGLAAADIVSLHVDLNPSTHHLIDADALARMKPTAILINTARGGVVDQDALRRALSNGDIAGAGLDVLETEPPDADDPILHLPNVVVLPHIGSATVETRLAMLDCAVDNLVACLRGEACANALALLPPEL
ncbi:MAG TPA: NAD(P)-dependent oxidoreductase [Acidimicrobiia bacterium]|jgi:glyoxylate reductase|nr:NAD(P)-dependent oxidoreductase [Acidimicrobiia bacterium]